MKLVFTTSGCNLDSQLEPLFGRAAYFLLYDSQTQTFDLLSNQQNLDSPQGAGIQAAQSIIKAGAEALITGHCGPKAFRVLTMAGIQVYNTNIETVKAALDAYLSGKLVQATSANPEGLRS
ncbi:NifB/NifX family molybdenum-iron cluster-binding protein [Escherichia albertii]|uniref:NifB/NifX family molybdenum-iron cluster-binding protein n=1 Tax=Escherichia albertii TaxID=208962 RepID=UPI000BF62C5D|nr:NifB/NifX family molybdenum-iron cluster-binding protein [Escherichia albertii]PFF93814.1 dinitrogenase iron-molybdenum cofactor biosynthesis protein [Escherichia albertii]WDB43102.1 NifB/NifX family molybdenum-iron cluster-binding protein [Escherichia albertii]WDB51463.1 NifB/NifX family molybdenum-iron cluster-binding protein [Escherichia albertii]HBM9793075.1 NifB/NifX family molybdenum-iron cluster-binding protein [Escherichia albertii]